MWRFYFILNYCTWCTLLSLHLLNAWQLRMSLIKISSLFFSFTVIPFQFPAACCMHGMEKNFRSITEISGNTFLHVFHLYCSFKWFTLTKVERSVPLECMYFLNMLFVILHSSLAVLFILHRYQSAVAMLIALHSVRN